jgi:hypothetical protein
MADDPTLTETLGRMTDFVAAQSAFMDSYSAMIAGTANGGPDGDGLYPVAVRGGATVLLPSPARIRVEATSLRLLLLQPTGWFEFAADQVNAICRIDTAFYTQARLPARSPIGATIVAIQWGAGQITLAGHDGGHTIKPHGASSTGGRGTRATAMAVDIDAQGDTIWLLEGDAA